MKKTIGFGPIWRWLINSSSRIPEEIDRRRARVFQKIVIIIFPFIFAVGIVIMPAVSGVADLWSASTFLPASIALLISIISLVLSRSGMLRTAMAAYAAMFVACPAIAAIQETSAVNLPIGTLMIGGAVVAASLFEDVRISVGFAILVVLSSFLVPVLNAHFTLAETAGLIAANLTNGTLIVAYSFHRTRQERERRASLEQAYDDLRQSRQLSDLVIESLPGVFYICDRAGKLLRWTNHEMVRIGYSGDEIAQMNLFQLFEGDTRHMTLYVQDVFQAGSASVEASITTKAGVRIPVYLTGFRINTDGQQLAVGVGIDISERKRLEEQLLHAQKMESIGQLAGGIAHDFNNILTAILGSVSILRTEINDSGNTTETSEEYLNQILTSAKRASNLTQSLLAFSRKQVINPRDIDLNGVIQKFETLLSHVIGEDITLASSLTNDTIVVFADEAQIEQILLNLATNARDAMARGGRLRITTQRRILDEKFIRAKGFGHAGAYAVLSVSDSGSGMDKETQRRIFDPFFTSKEVGKGTGLGLAIVYGIVEQNRGHISVSSQLGEGTTFEIYLPISSAVVESGEKHKTEEPPVGGSETILLVEDDADVRRMTAEAFRVEGYTVLETVDGEDALREFNAHVQEVDLIILDVILPKKNGRDVYEEILRAKPDIKVLFVSGYPADRVQEHGVLENGLNFLPKPSPPDQLLRKVRELLED